MALPKKIQESVSRQGEELLETGRRFNHFNQIRQRHFWSTHLFKPSPTGYINAGAFQLFAVPTGQSGQGFLTPLTELETNWKSASRVPDNQNFEITEIGVSLFTTPQLPEDQIVEGEELLPIDHSLLRPFDAVSFLQGTVIAITYLTNQVELGLAQDFAQASGPTVGVYQPSDKIVLVGDDDENSRQDVRYATNGFVGPGLRRRLKIPILLQHGETFNFTFVIPRAFFVFPINFLVPNKDLPSTVFIYARFDFWATESFVEQS